VKLPRDFDGDDLIGALGRIGYTPTRQVGSHIRLTFSGPPEHHVTVPNHHPVRVGTLEAILADVAERRGIAKTELIALLSG